MTTLMDASVKARVRARAPFTAAGLCAVVVACAPTARADAQSVVAAWGTVQGMRVEGEVFPFELNLCTVDDTGRVVGRTAKEKQQPHFARLGSRRTVTTRLGEFAITETVEDGGPGDAMVRIHFAADSATHMRGFVCLDAPRSAYADVRVLDESITPTGSSALRVRSPGGALLDERHGRGVSLESANDGVRRRVDISGAQLTPILLGTERRAGEDNILVVLPVTTGGPESRRSGQVTLSVKATGLVDHSPMAIVIDASMPGRVFDGLGGNFRIQNRAVDPGVIAYNLAHLRVAWARVEMPWRSWQPDTLVDPAAQDTSRLDPRTRAAMEMARTAAAKGARVIVSAWFPPQWAVIGPLPRGGALVNGQRGNPLDSAKMGRIYESITSYLLYLRRHYGVEAAMFSFNESDLGIDVRQTSREHADLIKGLGAYMKGKGLSTTMLLGDVSDATPTGFIADAMDDAATWPYIGAVSYHSWRGWSDALLTFWSSAAKRLGVPLLVGEGSTDAGAHQYPAVFQESDFALQEIELYVRMLALSEPMSILQWQLTSDYSILAGGGVYGDTTELRPTQRFWNLKQLASTPPGALHLPMHCDAPVSCAALGNARDGTLALHIVNAGAARPVTIAGFPNGVSSLRVWRTDAHRAMAEGPRMEVRGGRATLTLDEAAFTTLIATP